jgi:hypothetical protein
MDRNSLRDKVLIEMVRRGYGAPGSKARLAAEIGISPVCFSKALHGYYKNDALTARVLVAALDCLKNKNGKANARSER